MKEEKHLEAIAEVKDTISQAIQDARGLYVHQRRLASLTSLGAQQLIELHLHNAKAIKQGAQVKHEWFRTSKERIELHLRAICTEPLSKIPDIDYLVLLACEIEKDRNELVYGAPAPEARLRKKIDLFLEMEKAVLK